MNTVDVVVVGVEGVICSWFELKEPGVARRQEQQEAAVLITRGGHLWYSAPSCEEWITMYRSGDFSKLDVELLVVRGSVDAIKVKCLLLKYAGGKQQLAAVFHNGPGDWHLEGDPSVARNLFLKLPDRAEDVATEYYLRS